MGIWEGMGLANEEEAQPFRMSEESAPVGRSRCLVVALHHFCNSIKPGRQV